MVDWLRNVLLVFVAVVVVSCGGGNGETVAPSRSPQPSDVGSAAAYIAPAVVRMASDAGVDVHRTIAATIERVAELLPNANTADVIVKADEDNRARIAIPKIGVGGQVRWPSGQVEIAVDTGFDGDRTELFKGWLPRVLAHELHHHARYAAVDRPVHTLLDNLVTDGLAIAFADEVFPHGPAAPWADALTPEQEARWWKHAAEQLSDDFTRTDFEQWFFGRGEIPRWAGYTLGAHLVDLYLEAVGATAAESAHTDAKRVLEESSYSP